MAPTMNFPLITPMLIVNQGDTKTYIDLHADINSAQTLDLIKLLFLLGVYKTRSTPMGATINLSSTNIPRYRGSP